MAKKHLIPALIAILIAGVVFVISLESFDVKVSAEAKEKVEASGLWGVNKHLGNTMKVVIPKDFDIINVTWKEGSLWLLLKSNVDGHHEFIEKSTLGILESKVIFNK